MVARSSVEAEFRAIGLVLKQNFEPLHVGYVSFFGQIILTDLRVSWEGPIKLYCDEKLGMTHNPF